MDCSRRHQRAALSRGKVDILARERVHLVAREARSQLPVLGEEQPRLGGLVGSVEGIS